MPCRIFFKSNSASPCWPTRQVTRCGRRLTQVHRALLGVDAEGHPVHHLALSQRKHAHVQVAALHEHAVPVEVLDAAHAGVSERAVDGLGLEVEDGQLALLIDEDQLLRPRKIDENQAPDAPAEPRRLDLPDAADARADFADQPVPRLVHQKRHEPVGRGDRRFVVVRQHLELEQLAVGPALADVDDLEQGENALGARAGLGPARVLAADRGVVADGVERVQTPLRANEQLRVPGHGHGVPVLGLHVGVVQEAEDRPAHRVRLQERQLLGRFAASQDRVPEPGEPGTVAPEVPELAVGSLGLSADVADFEVGHEVLVLDLAPLDRLAEAAHLPRLVQTENVFGEHRLEAAEHLLERGRVDEPLEKRVLFQVEKLVQAAPELLEALGRLLHFELALFVVEQTRQPVEYRVGRVLLDRLLHGAVLGLEHRQVLALDALVRRAEPLEHLAFFGGGSLQNGLDGVFQVGQALRRERLFLGLGDLGALGQAEVVLVDHLEVDRFGGRKPVVLRFVGSQDHADCN